MENSVIEWYVGKTGNDQGLVIDSKTGKNIAVTYDKKDADTVVKAVNTHYELLEVCKEAYDYVNLMLQSCDEDTGEGELSYKLEQAIKKAEAE